LKLGDRVIWKQEQRNKFETAYDPTPGVIIAMKGSMLIINHRGKEITRNVSKFRKGSWRSRAGADETCR
jgi:hypothetical protein